MTLLSRLWRSSVGKQAIAALSGLVLLGWLILHVAGNLLVFSGPEATDGYAAALRRAPALLWLARALTALALVLHVAAVTALFRQARAARGGRAPQRTRAATFASRGMRVGGVLLLGFLVLHLLHLTFGVLHPRFDAARVYDNVAIGLGSPLVAFGYVLAGVLVGLHLVHGTWAAAQSLGIPLRARRSRLVLVLAAGVALGFAAVPVGVLLGVVR